MMNQVLSALADVASFVEQYGSLILFLLLLLPILIPLLVLLPVQMVKGYKRGVYRALISLGCSVVAGALSVFFAKIFADIVSTLVLKSALNGLISLIPIDLSDISEMLGSLTYSTGAVRGLLSFLLALIFYFVLLIVLLSVSKPVVDVLVKLPLAASSKKMGMKVGGLFIGVADAVIIALLLVLPIYTIIGNGVSVIETASDAVESSLNASETTAENENDNAVIRAMCDSVSEFCDTAKKSPPVVISRLPLADFTDSVFARFKCDGQYFNFFEIVRDGVSALKECQSLIDVEPKQYGEDQINAVDNIVTVTRENSFLYGLIHDGVFVAMKLAEQLPEEKNLKNDLYHVAVDSMQNASVEDISDSFDTLADIFAISVRHGIFANIDDKDALVVKLEEEVFVTEAVCALRSCDILSDTVDKALLVSLDYVDFSNGRFEDADFEESIETVKSNIRAQMESGKPDVESEINAFKCLLSGMTRLSSSTDNFSDADFEKLDTKAFSDVLVGFGLHPYIGTDGIKSLLNAVLPTMNDKVGGIFTVEFIDDATAALVSDVENYGKESYGKFANLFESARVLTVTVQKMSVSDKENTEKNGINDLVGTLLTDTTPETAEILKTAVTGEVIGKLSNTSANTDAVSGMIGDLIVNMANANITNEEERIREQEGITEMVSLAFTASERLKEPIPEGSTAIEQVVGGDLEEFITKVTSSDIAMASVKSTVEKNEGKADPTESFKNLSDSDKAAVIEACNAVESDSDSADISEKLDLICYFMGITE